MTNKQIAEKLLELVKFYQMTAEETEVLEMAIKALEQQKVGKWILCEGEKDERYDQVYKCSCCDCKSFKDNYCPVCGAKMIEPQEISDSNLKMWIEIFAEEKRREGDGE